MQTTKADPEAAMTPTYTTFGVRHLTPHVGGEIVGLDLSQPLDEAQVADLRAALADRGVLYARDQHLDREAHKAIGRHFGELHVHPTHHDRPDHDPNILVVKTTADSPYTAGDAWHADVTCDERPPYLSALYVTETPEGGGGDTMYADMALAFDLLSPSMQAYLQRLTAVHDGGKPYVGAYGTTPPEGGYPRNEHPIVLVHPVSGRKVIYVNPGFTTRIRGLRGWESDALLQMLYDMVPKTPEDPVPGAVGTQHDHAVGQLPCSAPCGVGLLPTVALRRTGLHGGRGTPDGHRRLLTGPSLILGRGRSR